MTGSAARKPAPGVDESAAGGRFPPLPRQAIIDLRESSIRQIANAAMGRQDVAAFWFGESDQATPHYIREAAIASLEAAKGKTKDGRTNREIDDAIKTIRDRAAKKTGK